MNHPVQILVDTSALWGLARLSWKRLEPLCERNLGSFQVTFLQKDVTAAEVFRQRSGQGCRKFWLIGDSTSFYSLINAVMAILPKERKQFSIGFWDMTIACFLKILLSTEDFLIEKLRIIRAGNVFHMDIIKVMQARHGSSPAQWYTLFPLYVYKTMGLGQSLQADRTKNKNRFEISLNLSSAQEDHVPESLLVKTAKIQLHQYAFDTFSLFPNDLRTGKQLVMIAQKRNPLAWMRFFQTLIWKVFKGGEPHFPQVSASLRQVDVVAPRGLFRMMCNRLVHESDQAHITVETAAFPMIVQIQPIKLEEPLKRMLPNMGAEERLIKPQARQGNALNQKEP